MRVPSGRGLRRSAAAFGDELRPLAHPRPASYAGRLDWSLLILAEPARPRSSPKGRYRKDLASVLETLPAMAA